MNLLIKGGRILDPSSGVDSIGDLLLQDGTIKEMNRHIDAPPEARVIDVTRMVVCPGFIDLHCHLREPGYEHKETIATGTQAAARGGFTTVCAMPNTNPAIDSPEVVETVLRKAREVGIAKMLPIGCVTEDRIGKTLADLAALARAGVIGFSDDGSPVADDTLMRQAILLATSLGLPVINHCEDLSVSSGGVMNHGAVAASLGLKGWPAPAEDGMVARDIALAEATGSRIHLAHISTADSVELVRRAKKQGISITAEATPHHLTLTEEWVKTKPGDKRPYNTNAKVNPPLRTQRDVDALVQGLADGTIDCIATDHAPHALVDKDCSFEEAAFGISGLETALGSLLGLVHDGRLDMATLVERLTTGPAIILKRPDVCTGTLRLGSPADVTIFDPNAEWTVDTSEFASKGRNTPLDGVTLKGRVMATVVDGRIVYEREAVRVG